MSTRRRGIAHRGRVGDWVLLGKLPAKGACITCDKPISGEALVYVSMRTGKRVLVHSNCANVFERFVSNPRTHKLHRVNPTNMYRAFHGADPLRKRVIRVAVPEPGDTLVKIGRLTQLNYIPEGNSKHKGTEFYHVSGDDGERIMKSNLILATDKSGKNFFLVKEEPTKKRPYFSSRGIIG